MNLWILAALGGALGASGRFALYRLTEEAAPIPLGALAANLLGCALAGFCAPVFARPDAAEGWRVFAVVGVFGGLTTFSAFVMDAHRLTTAGRWDLAALYGAATLMFGFILFLVAAWVGERLWSA